MRKILILAFIFIADIIQAQQIVLRQGWYVKNSIEVSADGKMVSTIGYHPQNWYSTTVPSTVLNTFVKNGIYPDPRIGMNNYLIPDVSDVFNQKHDLSKYSYLKDKRNPWADPYWYRTEFTLSKQYEGKAIWLTFKGINYRADIWMNGHLVADHRQVVGMFRRFKFDVTPYCHIGRSNCIAVKIYQVDHPGVPAPGTQFKVFGDNRGHADDIFKDETMKMSGGWDCAPVVRDRNMGIYQDVVIETYRNVSIENPCVVTTLPGHKTSKANVSLSAEIKNVSHKRISGMLNARITVLNDIEFPTYTKHLKAKMLPIQISKKITLNPGEVKIVSFTPDDYPALTINNPYLWYPNGYGEQYLHHLKLSFKDDVKELDFGIREITTYLNKNGNDYGRVFCVNGKRIFCKGGWLQPDALLNSNRKRIFDEARLLAEANVNIIGSEDAPAPPDEVIESYDKYGLMYWEVFYQCWRMYPGTSTEHNPSDHQLAVEEVRDIVKRYRNNPSIIAWFAANEVIVDKDLYRSTKEAVQSLDMTRPFIPTTSTSWDIDKLTPYLKEDMPTGTTDDGTPDYNWNPSAYYFNKVEEVHLQMFRNEMGIPSLPLYSSLSKFIPTVTKDAYKSSRDSIYPLDSIWAEHGAWDGDHYCFRDYDNAIRRLYGNPTSALDYATKAQFVNADGYRAMYEAANHRMWDITSGVMLWKLNSCWPDVGWQIYDWYLNPNASYYFAKRAMEPIHIQMNANSSKVSVINTTDKELRHFTVTAKVVDAEMKVQWMKRDTLTVNADCYNECMTVPAINKMSSKYYFVKLELRDDCNRLISDNVYWLSANDDFSAFSNLPKPILNKRVEMKETDKEFLVTVTLKNETAQLSFFNHLVVLNASKRQEVLPAFWSDNFITLFPQEQKTVKLVVAKADLDGQQPVINIE